MLREDFLDLPECFRLDIWTLCLQDRYIIQSNKGIFTQQWPRTISLGSWWCDHSTAKYNSIGYWRKWRGCRVLLFPAFSRLPFRLSFSISWPHEDKVVQALYTECNNFIKWGNISPWSSRSQPRGFFDRGDQDHLGGGDHRLSHLCCHSGLFSGCHCSCSIHK